MGNSHQCPRRGGIYTRLIPAPPHQAAAAPPPPRVLQVAAVSTVLLNGQSRTGHSAMKKPHLAIYAGMLVMALAWCMFGFLSIRCCSCGHEKKSYQKYSVCAWNCCMGRGLAFCTKVSVIKSSERDPEPLRMRFKAFCKVPRSWLG